MHEQFNSSSNYSYQKPKTGRPTEQQQKHMVCNDFQEMDFPVIEYMSKFGIQDGLACEEDDEEGERIDAIKQIYGKYQKQIGVILNKFQGIKHEDIVVFIDVFANSVDQIFYPQYCQLLIHVFLSVNFQEEEIQSVIDQFLKTSKVFSLKSFSPYIYEDDKQQVKIKTKPIKKLTNDKFNKKILAKIKSNLANFNKRSKSKNETKSNCKLKYLLNEQQIKKQFKVLFDKLRQMVVKFMIKPQPFLTQCRIMRNCLFQIMTGMQNVKDI